ncbi:MAG: flagellar basal body-associated FliL family protein [Pirellulales bacterium]
MSATATAPASAPAEAAPAGQKSGWFWKAVVLGLILSVIGAECLFAFVYVTTATNSATKPEAEAPAKSVSHEAAHGHAEKKDHANAEHGKAGEHGVAAAMGEEQEIDMGEYSLTAFQPASNTTLLINFHLYGTIGSEEGPFFAASYEANKHRIRDHVLTTIRSAELADLTDPGLGLIKRQILEKTNRALGKPVLQGIVFSDFVAVEQ